MEVDEPMDEEMNNDGEEMSSDEEDDTPKEKKNIPRKVYLPGKPMQSDEKLVCDESAYVMLHSAKTGAPCLSFDLVPDSLGTQGRETVFPMSCYLVAGTQGERKNSNNIVVVKMSNLYKTQKEEKDSDSENDDSSDEEEDSNQKPRLDSILLPHKGCVNRIRANTVGGRVLAATWSELGVVSIWNVTDNLKKLEGLKPSDGVLLQRVGLRDQPQAVHTFSGHQTEGYAMDWCHTIPGMLATGDCAKNIHVWTPKETGNGWIVNQVPLKGHTASVEDLQWSPNEQHVLASCSVDCSIRIWDVRNSPVKANQLTIEKAHESDVNVIHWNKTEPLIVSGGDDGKVQIWDLRQFKSPVAVFKHHTAPVTTVEWHPSDSSVFASGGSDNQIALWDLAVERDETEQDKDLETLPPQLLFIHQGQRDIKELHWHPQISGLILSTAENGFNIFKTISV